MKAVVLAGGQEFGQCPLSRQLPRALWPLVDRPVIEHVVRALQAIGIGHLAISANGRTHSIAERLGDGLDRQITIHYSEDLMPRGAAGCLKDCEAWLAGEPFLVVQGNSLLLDLDFNGLLDEHRRNGAALTVAATAEDPVPADRPAQLKPAGLYIGEPAILAHIKDKGYQDIKEQLIPRLIGNGLKVQAVHIRGRVVPIANEEGYLNAVIDVLNDPAARRRFVRHLPATVPGLWIDPAADIHPQARVVAPAYVGPGARLEADSVVIGPAMIGENCRVGAEAVVHESVLWSGATVGAGALVEQAILAANAAVAPGIEVRGSIVLDTNLSTAERESLSGSTDLTTAELSPGRGWLRGMLAGLHMPWRHAVQTH